MLGETDQHFDFVLLSKCTEFLVIGRKVNGEVVGPSFPKTYSFVGSRRHDSKVDCFCSSSEETFDVTLLLRRNRVQDSSCGGGK